MSRFFGDQEAIELTTTATSSLGWGILAIATSPCKGTGPDFIARSETLFDAGAGHVSNQALVLGLIMSFPNS